MTSLYTRLFAYRERSTRSPKEDYLTEALADLLSRMPPNKMQEFIADRLLPAHQKIPQALHETDAKMGSWRWISQQPIKYRGRSGRLDLVLCTGKGEPLLIIENKISAGVGVHEVSLMDVPDDGEEKRAAESRISSHIEVLNQLEFYCQWLAEKRHGMNWHGAVCLLTHNTPPPAGFGTRDGDNNRKPWQHVCRWCEVWSWLDKEARAAHASSQAPWQIIAGELAEYLKEERMSSESITGYDIAACQLFLKSGQKFKISFNSIWNEIKSNALKEVQEGYIRERIVREPFSFESSGGVVWDWIYLRPPYSWANWNNWYLGWGSRFPELSSWWKDCAPPLPDTVHVFVVWASEEKPAVPYIQQGELPRQWIAPPDGGAIVAQPVSKFEENLDTFADEIAKWIAEKVKEVLPVINQIVHSAKPV